MPEGEAGGKDDLLASRDGEPRFVAADSDPQLTPAVLRSRPLQAPRRRSRAATTDTELQPKGRRAGSSLVTPGPRLSEVALYLDAWKRRIEQVGTVNFPNAARRSKLSGNPVVEVVLASSGGLVRADVHRSSGYGELDRAAMDILKLATPFEPFPEELAAKLRGVAFLLRVAVRRRPARGLDRGSADAVMSIKGERPPFAALTGAGRAGRY